MTQEQTNQAVCTMIHNLNEIQRISQRREPSVWSHFNIGLFFLTALSIPSSFTQHSMRHLKIFCITECYLNVPSSILKGLLQFSNCLKHYAFFPALFFFFSPSCLGLTRVCLFLEKSNMLFKIPRVLERLFSPASATHNYSPNSGSPISQDSKDPKRHPLIFCQNIIQAHFTK